MATYSFSSLNNNDSIAFDPNNDALFFDQAFISAASLVLVWDAASITITADGKQITLTGVTIEQVTTSNVTFADGSQLLVGDNLVTTSGDGSDNYILGATGDDHILGLGGNDTLLGSNGNDTIIGGTGDDTVDGGSGSDTASYRFANATVEISLSQVILGDPTPDGADTLLNIENLEGSSFSDFLEGDAGNNVISGLGGDDTLWGRVGNDTIYGGDGNDLFDLPGPASVRLGDDLYYGDAGDDLIRAGGGNDTFDGGSGADRVSYSSATAGVYVDLSLGQAIDDGTGGHDVLISIENLSGSLNADTLIGDTGDNWIAGFGGNDTIDGGAGNDTIAYSLSAATGGVQVNLALGIATGAEGNDFFYNFENIDGSIHADVLIGDSSSNLITPWNGDDTVDGGAGEDTVAFVGNRAEYLIGAIADGSVTVNDTVDRDPFSDGVQNDGFDTLGNIETLHFADRDVEVLNGTSGNNTLAGGSAESILFGLGGNDILVGGSGNDLLLGGTGADTFKWNAGDQGSVATPAVDTIADFDPKMAKNTDALDLRDLLQGEHARKAGGNLAGFLHFSYDAANNQTILEVKSEGGFSNKSTTGLAGDADQLIYFTGVDLVGAKKNQDAIIDGLLQVNKLITD